MMRRLIPQLADPFLLKAVNVDKKKITKKEVTKGEGCKESGASVLPAKKILEKSNWRK